MPMLTRSQKRPADEAPEIDDFAKEKKRWTGPTYDKGKTDAFANEPFYRLRKFGNCVPEAANLPTAYCEVRYDYSTRTVRDDYSYSTRTVQYRTRVRCRVLEYWSTVRWISSFFCNI